ncbi:hypothetical protein CNYM01_14129 [Colletotrichum nymphaeae SA-01]|uniref:Uncharacterized protein n=1 Tax=Colletotrichum nymphaeae SA-01 TaxID=1460502 RepID=A0A135UWC3_9PEZI|nr:hypothetical protein CNYM01_14129 [Colletotrichum nymphaeae SA-01]
MPKSQEFHDDVKSFLETYITSQGWRANTINDWGNPEHRLAFGEMARAFTVRGKRFWPDSEGQGRINVLKYPTDRKEIEKSMERHFLAVNLKQHGSEMVMKVNETGEKVESVASMNGSGLTYEDPIDVDLGENEPRGSDHAGRRSNPSSTRSLVPANHPQSIDPSVVEFAVSETQQSLPNGQGVSNQAPKISGIHVEDTQNQPIFASMLAPVPNADRRLATYAGTGSPFKRPRLETAKPPHTKRSRAAAAQPPTITLPPNTRVETQSARAIRHANGNNTSASVRLNKAISDVPHSIILAVQQPSRIASGVGLKIAETSTHQPAITNQTPRTATARLPPVKFKYRVETQQPERQFYDWRPKGKFRSKTLAELVAELKEKLPHLPWTEIKFLRLRLKTLNDHVETTLSCRNEEVFGRMKQRLARFIEACIAETPQGEDVSVSIDIVLLTTSNSLEGPTEAEEIDFDW